MSFARLHRLSLPLVVALAGCSAATNVERIATHATAGFHGSVQVHGGQQPIVGATINIYAVGTTGYGSAATSVLAAPLTTDSNGYFDLTNKVTCPSTTSLLYLVATGGNPGVPPPFSGPQISLMTALGQCGNPNNIQFINVNEVTTVAAIYGLSLYMVDTTHIGSSSDLTNAFNQAWAFADITKGTSPGSITITGDPVDLSDIPIPSAQINSLANLLSGCINSSGGAAGDSTVCGRLFTLLTPSSGTAPIDTATALLNLALDPGLNTSGLYALIPPVSPFQPSLTHPPTDFGVFPADIHGPQPSPTSISFPGVTAFGVPRPAEIVVSPPLDYGWATNINMGVAGPAANDFTLSGPNDPNNPVGCVNGLADPNQGHTCYLFVTFKPTAAGQRKAAVVISYGNYPDGNTRRYIYIPLLGFGAAPTTTPLTLSSNLLTVSQYNTPYPITVTNPGMSNLPLSIAFTSLDGPYYMTGDCGTVLLAHASCTVNVLLSSPGSPQFDIFPPPNSSSASLSFSTSSTSSQYVGVVSNVGTFAPPNSFDLGTQAVGTTGSISWSWSDRTGGYESFAISGDNASDFSFAPDSQQSSTSCSWNPFGECDLTVYFTPSATGPRTATINVQGVGNISLSGTGQ